jgi:hypothetical protein
MSQEQFPAVPVRLDWMNANLQPPSPNSKVVPLPCHTDGRICTSVWKLSPEAMKWIIENQCIVVQVFSGPTQPPIGITHLEQTEEEFTARRVES